MVAAGAARDLLLMMRSPERVQPPPRRFHPFDLYWVWVFSTDKRLWVEARRRCLDTEPWRPCCGSCGSEAIDPHGWPWICCLQYGSRWDGSEVRSGTPERWTTWARWIEAYS